MIILGIITSIIMFSIIILIHEWGHFAAARKFGVKVEEFGLGIPPRAKKLFTDKKGTIFSLNWLPIGGFVRLYGENAELLENKNDKNALFNKPSWQQAIIILAGVFMNFLLATTIFSILFFIGIKPLGINTKIETSLDLKLIPTYEQAIKSGLLIKNKGIILSPLEGSIAEKAGIKNGDILLKAPYPPSGTFPQEEKDLLTPEKLIKIIGNNSGKKLIFTIKRNNKTLNIPIIPSSSVGNLERGQIGSYVGENIKLNSNFEYNYGFIDSIKYGCIETYNQTLLTFKGLGILLRKIFNPETPKERQEAIAQVSGPIGIVDFISSSLEGGLIFLIVIGAIISINLGVFNLLPIPALDGGRFLFITINGLVEKAFGRKAINEKTEGIIHIGFFIVLIALSLLIAYNDISKIIIR